MASNYIFSRIKKTDFFNRKRSLLKILKEILPIGFIAWIGLTIIAGIILLILTGCQKAPAIDKIYSQYW